MDQIDKSDEIEKDIKRLMRLNREISKMKCEMESYKNHLKFKIHEKMDLEYKLRKLGVTNFD